MKPFNSNEECAVALYRYLIDHKHISAKEPFVVEDNILHDINNLRGHEWLELLPRTAETEAFFAYLSPDDIEKEIAMDYKQDVVKIKELADTFLQQVDFMGNENAYTDRLLEDLLRATSTLRARYYAPVAPLEDAIRSAEAQKAPVSETKPREEQTR